MEREEIPDTQQGIQLYYNYCNKQIKENRNHVKRLERRMVWCEEKALVKGVEIYLTEEKERVML